MRKLLLPILLVCAAIPLYVFGGEGCSESQAQTNMQTARLAITAASALASSHCAQEAGASQEAARCVALTDALDDAGAAVAQAQRVLQSKDVTAAEIREASDRVKSAEATLRKAIAAF
jgi:hypothetical protein